MTTDQKTTIAGLFTAIGAVIVAFWPAHPEIGGLVTAIGAALLGWYSNKT